MYTRDMNRERLRQALLTALCLAVITTSSKGETQPPPSTATQQKSSPPARTDAQVTRQLDMLQREFDAGETYAKVWYFGWMSGFAAISGANVAIALTSDDKDTRQEATLAAVTSGLGFVSTVVLPPTAAFAPPRLRAMPDATPEQRAKKLAYAETAMRAAAQEESFGTSWLPHIATAIVNTTSFAIRLFAFKHETLAFVAIAPSMAIGEAKVLTTPTRAMSSSRLIEQNVTWVPSAPTFDVTIRF